MKKILVIEDNAEVRENLVEILELSNYEVESAVNGVLGVKLALEWKPDLILCDVMMPELDGFGVLRILSQKSETSDTPFIFLTAKTERNDFRTGMSLGADDYITKPFDQVDLLNAIEMRLRKSERIKAITPVSDVHSLDAFFSEAKATEEMKKLSDNRDVLKLHKKDIIFEEGELARRLYFVAKGKIKTYKSTDFGKELIIKIYNEGEFLGYEPLINEGKYSESAAAFEDAEVAIIPKEDFFTLLHANRGFATRFIKMLANNVLEREEQLLGIAYNSVRRRLADALLMLHDRYEHEGKAEFNILREDLANITGTAKETIIRTLTDFKSEGLIDIHDNKITILKKDKLVHMPN